MATWEPKSVTVGREVYGKLMLMVHRTLALSERKKRRNAPRCQGSPTSRGTSITNHPFPGSIQCRSKLPLTHRYTHLTHNHSTPTLKLKHEAEILKRRCDDVNPRFQGWMSKYNPTGHNLSTTSPNLSIMTLI